MGEAELGEDGSLPLVGVAELEGLAVLEGLGDGVGVPLCEAVGDGDGAAAPGAGLGAGLGCGFGVALGFETFFGLWTTCFFAWCLRCLWRLGRFLRAVSVGIGGVPSRSRVCPFCPIKDFSE